MRELPPELPRPRSSYIPGGTPKPTPPVHSSSHTVLIQWCYGASAPTFEHVPGHRFQPPHSQYLCLRFGDVLTVLYTEGFELLDEPRRSPNRPRALCTTHVLEQERDDEAIRSFFLSSALQLSMFDNGLPLT